MDMKIQRYIKTIYTFHIEYGVFIQGWKYLFIHDYVKYSPDLLDLIEELIRSKDYDNYLLAKAMINGNILG